MATPKFERGIRYSYGYLIYCVSLSGPSDRSVSQIVPAIVRAKWLGTVFYAYHIFIVLSWLTKYQNFRSVNARENYLRSSVFKTDKPSTDLMVLMFNLFCEFRLGACRRGIRLEVQYY